MNWALHAIPTEVDMNNNQGIFEVFDTTLAQSTPDVLGIWTPQAASTGVAFAAGTQAEDESTCWRGRLPTDLRLAVSSLYQSETRLARAEQALPKATSRLTAAIQQEQSGHAFDLAASSTTPAAEAELFQLLQTLQQPSASFGIGEGIASEWNKVTEQFQSFTERVLKVITHYAWVETYMGEQLLGKTSLSWTGDISTVWPLQPTSAQVMLHQRMVVLTLSSRMLLMRIFILVLRGVATLSTLLASPAGPILAAPALWNFMNLVLTEYSAYQQSRTQ